MTEVEGSTPGGTLGDFRTTTTFDLSLGVIVSVPLGTRQYNLARTVYL